MKLDWESEAASLRHIAGWRRRNAEWYPEESRRNLEAAECLDRIADDLVKPETELLRRRVETLIGDDPFKFGDEWGLLTLYPPSSAVELLQYLADSLERFALVD